MPHKISFFQPVECDAAVEIWLGAVISTIKSTLQVSLASAIGMPLPESVAIKVSDEAFHSSKSETATKKTESLPRRVLFAPETGIVKELIDESEAMLHMSSSWSLRNVNEIVILALQIELTKKFEQSFEKMQSGDKNPLDDLQQHLSTIIESAAKVLQGSGESDRVHEVIGDHEESGGNADSNNTETDAKTDPGSTTKSDVTVILPPCQVQKLTNLIFVLSAKRDLALKLSELVKSIDENDNEAKKHLQSTFEWWSQFRYYWSQENATCRVSIMDYESEYGFEYQGTASKLITTPATDKALFWLSQGFAANTPGLVTSSSVCLVLRYSKILI